MFHKIMVAVDESPEAERALQAAIELASTLPAELSMVSVIEPPPAYYSFAVSAFPAMDRREREQAKYISLQAKACQQAKAAGLCLNAELVIGDEVSCIIQCARRYHADLLILGMPKHTLLTGHTAKDIADRSPCALMGIR